MLFKKTLLSAAVVAVTLLATPASHAANTNFKVILQPIAVLDYYQEIDLTVNSAALQTLVNSTASGNPTSTKAITATASGATLSGDAAIVPGGFNLSSVALTISNAWAVRSIATAGSGKTTVTVGLTTAGGASATLTGATDTTSTIGLSSPSTSFATLNGGTGFATPVKGDVKMVMDMSNAKSADTYAGGVIVITATAT